MSGTGARRIGTLILGSALLAAACSGTAPSGPAGNTPPASTAVSPSGLPIVEFATTADPAAGAQREMELVREIREEAGMPALLGERSTTFFDGLDAIQAEFALPSLQALAIAVDTGQPPTGAGTLAPGVQLASLDGLPAALPITQAAIDTSLFADTAFTASAFMTMLTGIVRSAGESGTWTLPKHETVEQVIDGLTHRVELNTMLTTNTGGGQVTVDVSLSATDRVFAADGSFVALYTDSTTGHFEVKACPNSNAIAEGTYSFTTKHELNEVGGAANVRSTGGRSATSPFRLVDGEDAHLIRIEADMQLDAEASGPGSPAGPGPTGPFNWTASQGMGVVMPAGGSTTISVSNTSASGTGSERAAGALLLTAGMAQLFFGQVAREAETFWRSGECIELTPSKNSRKVDPGEQLEIEIKSRAKFPDGGEIERPIIADFSGKDSIDPGSGSPMDYPAKLTFTAGSERGDEGIINLTQTSIRGIGKKTLEFEVEPLELDVTMDGHATAAGLSMDMTVPRTRLSRNDDGVYIGTAPATFAGTITSDGCSQSFSGSDTLTIRATIDEADRDRATIGAIPAGFGIIRVPFTCRGVFTNWPVPYAVFFGAFSTGTGLASVTIGETAALRIPGGAGNVHVTLERVENP